MSRAVIDTEHIYKILNKYSSITFSEEPLSRAELDLNLLCLELKAVLSNHSKSLETYTETVMINNNDIGHWSEEHQTEYKEHLLKELYYRLGQYLYEHNIGKVTNSKIDPITKTFTTTLQASVVEESQSCPVLRPDIDSACTSAPSEEMLSKLKEIKAMLDKY